MDAQALLAELRQRGATLRLLDGGRIGVSPRSVIDDSLRAEIRALKTELLRALEDPVEAPILEARADIGAVLTGGPFGEVWIALDQVTAEELRVEEAEREYPRPVLTPEDVASLRGKSKASIEAILEVAAIWPGARALQ